MLASWLPLTVRLTCICGRCRSVPINPVICILTPQREFKVKSSSWCCDTDHDTVSDSFESSFHNETVIPVIKCTKTTRAPASNPVQLGCHCFFPAVTCDGEQSMP